MSVLAGLTTDAGEILIDGVPVVFASPRAAIEVGIGMVISILSWLSRLQLLKTFSWLSKGDLFFFRMREFGKKSNSLKTDSVWR